MERQRRLRGRFFLFLGILLGALLGIFGNLWVAWYFETYKEVSWMPHVAWSSFGAIIVILVFMAILLSRWERELGET
jgi:uncharacterized membrane protein YeaQ/YmgE (transglycosylase-associated protein family)